MNYSKKDVIIGFVIILLIVVGVFVYKRNKSSKVETTPSPVSVTYKEDFENNFKYDLKDDKNSVELKDVSGGSSRGIATEKEILADLDNPDLTSGAYFYQAWLQKDENLVSLGKLSLVKGGWLIEYDKENYSNDYKKVVISLEKTFDNKIEKTILEGTFN